MFRHSISTVNSADDVKSIIPYPGLSWFWSVLYLLVIFGSLSTSYVMSLSSKLELIEWLPWTLDDRTCSCLELAQWDISLIRSTKKKVFYKTRITRKSLRISVRVDLANVEWSISCVVANAVQVRALATLREKIILEGKKPEKKQNGSDGSNICALCESKNANKRCSGCRVTWHCFKECQVLH